MIHSEYATLLNRGVDFGIDAGFVVTKFGGKCAVNGYVALKLSAVSPKYGRDNVIPISQSNSTSPSAYLVTSRSKCFGYGSASEFLVAAFLEDVRPHEIIDASENPRRDFVFRSDYLVVSVLEYADYMKQFRSGSGLWGGFVHVEELARKRSSYESKTQLILASANIEIKTDAETDILWRAIDHASPLERYLKLYHLVELMFDLVLVDKIKSLEQDLKGIGKLLSEYSGDNESERLIKIIKEYCPDLNFLEKVLVQAFSETKYHDQIVDLMFEHQKGSNPYKEEKREVFKNVLTVGFSVSELKSKNLPYEHVHLSKLAV